MRCPECDHEFSKPDQLEYLFCPYDGEELTDEEETDDVEA